MYINYKLKDGIEYAMVVTSVRKGASVTKEKPLYLGRVIDKEHGIFKNRVRGIYKYDIKTNTFSSVPAEYQEPAMKRKTRYPVRPTLVVSFGDVFLLDEFLKYSLKKLRFASSLPMSARASLIRCDAIWAFGYRYLA